MSVSCLENFADEVVDMCVDTVVAVIAAVYILPDMRYTVLGEIIVVCLGVVVNNCVVAAGCDVEEIGLIVSVPLECSGNSGCRTDSSDITELVRELHSDEERFASAH